MAGAVGGRVLVAMLLLLGLLHNAAATVYPVGASGWSFVMSGEESYDDQFKNINLVVGDVLSFVFANGAHNVLEVPAADVSTCGTSNAAQTYSSSVDIPLSTTGSHGFICGFPTHCIDHGMHLLVTVNAAAPPGASPPVSPTPAPAPAPALEGSTLASTIGSNTASVLQSGPAVAMGALLGACAVLAF